MTVAGRSATTGDQRGAPYRVMVVDDSAVIRGLLARTLELDPDIDVVATACNGKLALSELDRKDIEVVVLDIEMPVMDGLTALPLLIEKQPGLQVIIASTLTRKNAEISLRALQAGAKDYLTKPSSGSELNSAAEFKRELTEKISSLAAVARREGVKTAQPRAAASTPTPAADKPKLEKNISLRSAPITPPSIIAVGSSTGGPQALFEVLGNLAPSVSLPIVITQHMPPTFTTLLAEHITRVVKRPCVEGKDGAPIEAGGIYLAPGGYHMYVEARSDGNVIRLNQEPAENFCRPSVDPLLRSIAKIYGARILTVILTGMGSDGCKGATEVTEAGGTVIAQDEATSVVWGMPGAVATAGLCSAILPLTEIGPYVRKLVLKAAA